MAEPNTQGAATGEPKLYTEAEAKALAASQIEPLFAEMKALKETVNAELKAAARPPIYGATGQPDNGVAGGNHGNTKSVIRYLRDHYGVMKIHFDSVGSEMKTLLGGLIKSQETRTPIIAKTLSEGVNSAGGYTVEGGFVDSIWEKIFDDSYFLSAATKLTMTGEFISGAQLSQVFGTSPSYDSGMTFTWSDEAATISENTNPSFKLKEMRAKKVVGLQKLTRELMSDNPKMAGWLANKIAVALRRNIESKFYRGNGSTEPLGFIGHPDVLTQTRATGSRFKIADIVAMDNKVDEAFGENLVWFGRKATIGDLPNDVDTATQPKGQLFNNAIEATFSRRKHLNGYPVVISKHPSALGTAGDVVLCDPSAYIVAMREGMEIETSFEAFWTADIVGVKARARLDGQPLFPAGFVTLT